MGELERRGMADLAKLWRAAGLSDDFRAMIVAAFPELVIQWGTVAADLAAVWYEESASRSAYVARVADPPPLSRFEKSAEYALNIGTAETAPLILAGTLQRGVWGMSRDTTKLNAEREPGATWGRKARPGACDLCQDLADDKSDWYHDNCHCVAVETRP